MLHTASNQLLRSCENLVTLTLLILLALWILLALRLLLVLLVTLALAWLAAFAGSRRRAAGLAFHGPEQHCRLRFRGPGLLILVGLGVGLMWGLISRFRLNCYDAISWGVASTSDKT